MPTEVDQSVLSRLLDVQAEDSAVARLNHQKAILPEAQKLSALRERLDELRADKGIAEKQAGEAAREQDRLEGEIQILDEKTGKEEQRLYSGAISNPKELGALRDEVAMLKRKKAGLEDSLLEVMVQKEQADATLAELRGEAEKAASEEAELAATVEKLLADIDRELSAHIAAREGAVKDVPADVVELYEKLRESKGGVGAASLRDGTCEGCHTKLPAREVERVKAEGGLQRCDNCRRILVVI
jgi:uncharacterized protein